MKHWAKEKIKNEYDILVIGGGINGAGIALDASLRGYKVLLVDKNDFGSYATSSSTKLIHGGLRYLEYMEFPLVRESLRERERLLQNAPHLVKPLKIDFPFYKHSKRGPYILKLGMILYDILSYDKSMPNHSFLFKYNKEKLINSVPSLRKEGLNGIASYYDCQAQYPERLGLEILLSANREGADILNYCSFVSMKWNGKKYNINLSDNLTNDELQVNANFVVNATGPFVDEVNQQINSSIPRLMGGTKGSHIIIDKFDNGPKDGLYIEAVQDGRPFFILPWDKYYLVGTTDIFYDGDMNKIIATKYEVDYLLKELNYFIDSKKFTRKDILYTYSGIRPLPYEPNKAERKVTRSHIIYDHEKKDNIKNYVSIVGGKLTTYRNLSEDTVNFIENKNNINNKCFTKKYKLFGAKGLENIDQFIKENIDHYSTLYSLDKDTIKFLISFYGIKFIDVLNYTKDNKELREKITPELNDIKAQIVYAIEVEKARTIEGIIIRRTSIGTHSDLGFNSVEIIAEIAAPLLGYSESEKDNEIRAYKNKIKTYYNLNNKYYEKENNELVEALEKIQ